MMGSNFEVDEDQFFDTHDEITSVSDSGSDLSEDCSNPLFVNYGSNGFGDEFWTKDLESVHERRERFLKWMDFSIDSYPSDRDEPGNICSDELRTGIQRIRVENEPMLAISEFKNRVLLSQSSPHCQSIEDHELIEDFAREDNLTDKTEFVINQTLNQLRHEHGSNEEFENPLVLSSFDRELLPKEDEMVTVLDKRKKVKKGWLQKLSVMGRIGHKHEFDRYSNDIESKVGVNICKVRVHTHKKRLKELSSVYIGQDFQAHKGSILAIKFSPDGQYLASGGEDSVVRVWKVIEDESESIFNIQNSDPSCLYFSLNHLSKLAPLSVDKEKNGKTSTLKKSSESACVIFPPKVFRLLEKPLHEFCGHTDEILALSWSKNGHLISSSVDKTVRIWQVGNDDCLGVFSHNNYVTCVEFNPVDDNYFISGSIDGKVRIWEVRGCRVVDWIDVREIVSAVCYFPDGKGGIVGSMDGNCRFYDIIDNRLEKGAQICLQGKKKLPGKRITGFQFSPSDPSKVMVTAADSQVRILCGVNMVCKFKGARSSGNQLSASFTSDGKHIISTSDDSNIYTWNYVNQDNHRVFSKPKNVSSFETFSSHNASIAIPWGGNSNISQTVLPSPKLENGVHFDDNLQFPKMPLSPPDCLSLSRGFFLESLHRGTATWPEEKLPESPRSMCKSEYRFLKNAYQSTFTSPHMWGHVIVTAGWDGRIRSFLNYGLPIRS